MNENIAITDFISERRDEFYDWLKDNSLEDNLISRQGFCESHPDFAHFFYSWVSTHVENVEL